MVYGLPSCLAFNRSLSMSIFLFGVNILVNASSIAERTVDFIPVEFSISIQLILSIDYHLERIPISFQPKMRLQIRIVFLQYQRQRSLQLGVPIGTMFPSYKRPILWIKFYLETMKNWSKILLVQYFISRNRLKE
jgi:hypothetical protein